MNKYIVIFLISIVLASCQKTVIQNYTPKPQDYIGTWEHEVWINDTTEENEYLGLILRKTDNDTIKGVFYSVIKNAIKSQSVVFSGEPLSGVQIMGPLETRSLDFDKIIFLLTGIIIK